MEIIPCVSKIVITKSRLGKTEAASLVYHACARSLLLWYLMEAEQGEDREVGDDEKQRLRLRSRTTPPASNQFAMSNSLDSGVGSFEEADIPDKSCTTSDEQPSASDQQQYEAANSFRFIYLGSAVLDKRYTQHMLPWVIAEIRRKKERNSIDLNVEAMTVKAVDCSTTSTLFQHKVQTITRCARSVDRKCFAYLTKIPEEVSSCYCYVFEAVETSAVRNLCEYSVECCFARFLSLNVHVLINVSQYSQQIRVFKLLTMGLRLAIIAFVKYCLV